VAARQTELDDVSAGRLAELYRALAEPSRLRLIGCLLEGELHVAALAECVGISESAVSHHLRSLRQLRLVRGRKVGRRVYYALDDDHIRDLFLQGLDHVQHG
jgi:DNA-binding transcriptional ArsR family regulator